jgi:hypothetical protein
MQARKELLEQKNEVEWENISPESEVGRGKGTVASRAT